MGIESKLLVPTGAITSCLLPKPLFKGHQLGSRKAPLELKTSFPKEKCSDLALWEHPWGLDDFRVLGILAIWSPWARIGGQKCAKLDVKIEVDSCLNP